MMIRRLLLVACFACVATTAHAQIAFDAVSDSGTVSSTSLSWSHTTSGSDRVLLVTCRVGGAQDLTGVTYNGVAMSQIRGYVQLDALSFYTVMWGLVAPTTGTNSIVVTRSSSDGLACNGASYTGVTQSGLPEASGQNAGGAASSLTVSASVSSTGAWLVLGCNANYTSGAFTAGTSTTMRDEVSDFVGIQAMFDSNGTVSTGTQSLQCLRAADSVSMAGIVAVLAPSGGGGGGGGTACTRALLGVGCEAQH